MSQKSKPDMQGFPGMTGNIAVPIQAAYPGFVGQEIYDPVNSKLYKCVAPNLWASIICPLLPTLSSFYYASNGDTNGIFYNYGTQFGKQAWTNPHTAGYITVGGYTSSAIYGSASGAGAVDRDATTDNSIGNNAAGNYWQVILPAGASLNPNGITIRARPTGSGTASNVASFKIQGSNDGAIWSDIYTVAGLTYVVESEYKYNAFLAPGIFYRYIRLLWQANVTGANAFFFLTDWELYGDLAR